MKLALLVLLWTPHLPHQWKLKLAELTAAEVDAYTTRQNQTHGGYERDPLARPFVGSNSLYLTCTLPTVAGWLGEWAMRKRGNYKATWALRVYGYSLALGHVAASVNNVVATKRAETCLFQVGKVVETLPCGTTIPSVPVNLGTQ